MPYSAATWYVNKRVIHVRAYGDVTIDEMHAFNEQVTAMLDEGDPLVHLIVEDNDVEGMPKSLQTFKEAMPFAGHPDLGWVLPVGNSSPILHFLTNMAAKIYRVRYQRMDSFAEAVAFLKGQDPSVDWPDSEQTA